ncbi:radical SAM protein [Campylobacter gastrosuis]|uniref:Radical SAM protein n=1 Tax=Campylobacter gastrosuis TaxID=2974576 RepID=A0ABT7HSX3_9BACT|nr:radical SAM protein [Campylobacter gastrosuis]MDL0089893.1 radical SAM protein [Campylobacter gastrosuis]
MSENNIVFGPINSRRFGISLGIDLSPAKKCCNFDCVYCELSRAKTTQKIENPPSVAEILSEVSTALSQKSGIDVITITANGEPTLYPYLNELILELKKIKTTQKLLILSNGSGVLKDEIFNALLGLDIVKFSLDSVNKKSFVKIDRTAKFDPNELVKKMSEFRRVFSGELVLEVLVVSGFNDTRSEFVALNRAFGEILPHRVDISTIDRPPSYNVRGISSDELHELSKLITNAPVAVATKRQSSVKYDFSEAQIMAMLSRRPQSQLNVAENFSEISQKNLENLIKNDKIKTENVAGVLFYKLKI